MANVYKNQYSGAGGGWVGGRRVPGERPWASILPSSNFSLTFFLSVVMKDMKKRIYIIFTYFFLIKSYKVGDNSHVMYKYSTAITTYHIYTL